MMVREKLCRYLGQEHPRCREQQVQRPRGSRDQILEVFEHRTAEFADRYIHRKPSVDGSHHDGTPLCLGGAHNIPIEVPVIRILQAKKLRSQEVTQLAEGLTAQSGSKDGTSLLGWLPPSPRHPQGLELYPN